MPARPHRGRRRRAARRLEDAGQLDLFAEFDAPTDPTTLDPAGRPLAEAPEPTALFDRVDEVRGTVASGPVSDPARLVRAGVTYTDPRDGQTYRVLAREDAQGTYEVCLDGQQGLAEVVVWHPAMAAVHAMLGLKGSDGLLTAPAAPKHPAPAPADQAGRPVSAELPRTVESLAALPSGADRVRIHHTEVGTLVLGTERDDTVARAAVKDAGFRWSRRLAAWYLPRTMRMDTRTTRAGQVERAMRARGRQVVMVLEAPAGLGQPSASAAASPAAPAPLRDDRGAELRRRMRALAPGDEVVLTGPVVPVVFAGDRDQRQYAYQGDVPGTVVAHTGLGRAASVVLDLPAGLGRIRVPYRVSGFVVDRIEPTRVKEWGGRIDRAPVGEHLGLLRDRARGFLPAAQPGTPAAVRLAEIAARVTEAVLADPRLRGQARSNDATHFFESPDLDDVVRDTMAAIEAEGRPMSPAVAGASPQSVLDAVRASGLYTRLRDLPALGGAEAAPSIGADVPGAGAPESAASERPGTAAATRAGGGAPAARAEDAVDRVLPGGQDRIAALAPWMEHGPDYRRRVRDAVVRARFAAQRGEQTAVGSALVEAEIAAGLRQESDWQARFESRVYAAPPADPASGDAAVAPVTAPGDRAAAPVPGREAAGAPRDAEPASPSPEPVASSAPGPMTAPPPAGQGPVVAAAGPVDFRPGTEVLVPSGAKARAAANLAALRTLHGLTDPNTGRRRPAGPDEQRVLAGWSSWGAVPEIFDEAKPTWAAERAELRALLTDREWAEARRTTINAHYTDPGVVAEMWSALGRLGFTGGPVLEPGCGSGTFIGLAPEDTQMVGVELDSTTAAIAQALYPSADVRAESFADTRLPEGSVVGAVGNVPFANTVLFDPAYNQERLSMHNHFLVKALRLTAPGGYVAAISSRYTLDAADPKARRELARFGDLAGAVRLPAGAFRRVAGTDVVTDVLLFRRRAEGETPHRDPAEWVGTATTTTPAGEEVQLSSWFAAHPELVLGELSTESTQYGGDSLTVRPRPGADLRGALRGALTGVVADALSHGLGFDARPADTAGQVVAQTEGVLLPGARVPKSGGFARVAGGGFVRAAPAGLVPYDPGKKPATEFGELIDLRDTYLNLIDAQTHQADEATRAGLRAELNTRYDAYVRRHGPIGRFRWGKPTKNGEQRKITPRMGGFRRDPDFASMLALEVMDEDTQQVRKAAVFTRDVVADRPAATTADTPADALAIVLDETGRVDLARIAELCRQPVDQVREALRGEVFTDPDTRQVRTAAEYLSGDVRQALGRARAAVAGGGTEFAENVTALEAVQPKDVLPGEIDAQLGAPWIPDTDVTRFAVEALGMDLADENLAWIKRLPGTGDWDVHIPNHLVRAEDRDYVWGTDRCSSITLLTKLLRHQEIQVHEPKADGGGIDREATAAAVDKAERIGARFRTWVWEDQARADRLAGEYNLRFNATVPRRFDGSHMRLPGLGAHFDPRPWQRAAVARIVQSKTVLLDHAVGAGKTGEMVMGAMELKRLGLVRQPWIVVPNHMLEQFSREFKQWYPAANVLVADSKMSEDDRREFVARTATSDWDAVVITQTSFKSIPVSAATQRQYLTREVDQLMAAVEDMKTRSGREGTIKQLEKARQTREERLKALLSGVKDQGFEFEASGCDYLMVDEAHQYKNLHTESAMRDFQIAGAQQASDLEMKLGVLRDRSTTGRVATFATGTPVSNSLRELYTMQRYLAPEVLARQGTESFDAWAPTFVGEVTEIEAKPGGNGFTTKTRMARFRNVPELMAGYREMADVVGSDDLPGIKRPEIVGGRRRGITLDPDPVTVAHLEQLAFRAEHLDPTDRQADNMLKITGEGRSVALDPRALGLPAPAGGGKAARIAEEIMRIDRDTADRVYLTESGEESPVRGGMQIVFCDRSTPGGSGWNFYEQVRTELASRGMDPGQVRFVHDANTDEKKAALFADCRAGKVKVIIGSTEKMGVGTNIQTRAVALHHADCPWRPSDLEQREGRILRQGNQNRQVEVLAYGVARSFDMYMWQTVERKQKFISQLRHARATDREVEDIGGDNQALSFGEMKASFSGNPLMMEQIAAQQAVARFARLADAHFSAQRHLKWKADALTSQAEDLARTIDVMATLQPRVTGTRGDAFGMALPDDTVVTKRADAAQALLVAGRDAARGALNGPGVATVRAGTLGGLGVDVTVRRGGTVEVTVEGREDKAQRRLWQEFAQSAPGVLAGLEYTVSQFDTDLEAARQHLPVLRREAERARVHVGEAFDRQDELDAARARLARVSDQIAAEAARREDDQAEGEARPTPAPDFRAGIPLVAPAAGRTIG